jgi:spectinomycin phosphotransferase
LLTEPPDLDHTVLVAALERDWEFAAPRLEYLPVGFGSHHWLARDARGERRFVTVDDLEAPHRAGPDADASFAALERAFATASALRGLDFVAAPSPARDGAVVRRLSSRYAVTVSPYLDGTGHDWGLWEDPDERHEVRELLARLHAETRCVPPPRRDDLAVQSRAGLEDALATLAEPWRSGPFAEPLRERIAGRADELRRRLAAYDELAARVRARDIDWVVTHGEPHRGNWMRDPDGRLHLIDWDTTLLAPRERDLIWVTDEDGDAFSFYREWWALSDVAVFVTELRRPHVQTEQAAATFRVVSQNLADLDLRRNSRT